MSDSAYKPLTDAQNAFKTIVFDPLVKTGEVALDSAQMSLPVLNLPFVEGLEDDAIQAIADAFYSWLCLVIDIESIKLTNEVLQNKWATISESLAIISQEQGVNSDAYKNALAQSASDFAKFVHTGP